MRNDISRRSWAAAGGRRRVKSAALIPAHVSLDRVTEAAFAEDQDALKKLYAPDAVAETPDQGTVSGADAIAAWFGQFATAFPDASWESAHKHESGNVAIDEGYVVGTHTGPLPMPGGESVPPTEERARARLRRRDRRECACDKPPVLLRPDGASRAARARARGVATGRVSAQAVPVERRALATEGGVTEFTSRLSVAADLRPLRVLMDAAISELQRGFLDAAQIASSRASWGSTRS